MQPEQRNQPNQRVFYQLMEEVGFRGTYQTLFIALASVIFFQIGLIQLGVPYYFAVAPYTNCPKKYEGITICNEYTCGLPYDQRAEYENQQISHLKTLGNEFGDYHCQKSNSITAAMGVIHMGAIIGFTLTSILADNFGRRFTLLLCLLTSVIGYLNVLMARSLFIAQIGLFVAGFGVQSCLSVVFCILSQILQNNHRQKIQILLQVFICLGGIFIVAAFYLLKNWKIIFFCFFFLPLAICLVFAYFFVRETPLFMVKLYTAEEVVDNLKFIATLNDREEVFQNSYLLSEGHILELQVDNDKQMDEEHKKAFSYIDLVRYPSLRSITIWCFFLFFAVSFLYFGPLIIVDQFGFDFYINGIILNVTQLFTFIISYIYITRMKRKAVNLLTLAISLLCFFLLIFLNSEEVCTENCWTPKLIAELIVFFIMRFAVALLYQIIYLYITELYPQQVAALGLGFGCLIVSLPNVFLPELINLLNKSGFNIMIVFCIASVIGILASLPLKQTDGKHPQQKIEELLRIDHHHLPNQTTYH